MRKFKHKITGHIAVETITEKNYRVSEPKNFTIPKWIVENSNDWEEIIDIPVGTKVVDTNPETKGYTYEKLENGKWKHSWIDNYTISEDSIGEGKRFQIVKEEPKRDWEILSLIPTELFRGAYTELSDKKNINSWLKGYCKEYWQIKSIKRLSDGEIFTIGDKCNNDIIESFKLYDNNNTRLYVTSINNTWGLSIEYLRKDKNPVLFITEDGKEIYKGDLVTPVHTESLKIYTTTPINTGESIKYGNYKYFSTEEAAKNFILLNKSCLSINDVVNNFVVSEIKNVGKVTNGSLTLEKLKNLVKSKL